MKLNIDHSEKFDELVKEVQIENLFQLLQMGSWKENQMACSPDSPVLIRIALSRFITKIFPSPIRPV